MSIGCTTFVALEKLTTHLARFYMMFDDLSDLSRDKLLEAYSNEASSHLCFGKCKHALWRQGQVPFFCTRVCMWNRQCSL